MHTFLPNCVRPECLWHRRRGNLVPRIVFPVLLVASSAVAERNPIVTSSQADDLLQMSLEDLGKIKVTSVSRKSESLSSASAAVYVVTQDEIRRSGVTALPEALRLAPGLNVARANSRQWAISSRGFNDVFANKLLVLMDGRTLYTPLFSGVFWEEADTVLEDVDRIEVIRGPGATLWGANAVNGVINIITKSAKETQGVLISGGGGLEERGFGTVRYGIRAGENLYLRAYGKYVNRDASVQPSAVDANDAWWASQGGFRLDWEPRAADTLTVQGDYYSNESGGKVYRHSYGPVGVFPSGFRAMTEGGNALARWTHRFSEDSEMAWQAFYDRTDRGFGIAREIRGTADVDVQHRFRAGSRHEIVWGGGYRYSGDAIDGTEDFSLRDPSVGLQLFSAFVQDEVALASDHLRLTFGSKIEHNDFTGFELQPSGRITWMPHEHHTVWGAISRAVRTPSRVERDLRSFVEPFPLVPGVLVLTEGNPEFRSEELLAYEVGYRVTVHPRLTLDWAAYYNDYEQLRDIIQWPIELRFTPTPHFAETISVNNNLFGTTRGVEMSATWQPKDAWRLRAGYAFLDMHLQSRSSELSVSPAYERDNNPRHQASLQSDVDFGRHVEWGLTLRYVDHLAYWGGIPGYVELDARLAWKPTKNTELALIGRNLLDGHHREFSPLIISIRDPEVERAIYAKVTLRF